MALESAQDLENFFDTETHGKNATVSINGTSSSIKVILNNEYFEIPGESVNIDGTQPIATCRSSDIANLDTDDSITIDSVTYNIKNIQPDNEGITELILQKQ
ncbi:MAG: hypothetical protein GOVbin1578_36 [Prokaryotic dsDNA virus sp.]|nr:MAG: hypothetical protein GOVbin1578_36 [Prokaryotic dsDNA virus sp.]|tara:strand:- start:4297 stop:4602 length:306 start_codon:yes stop_codon:yes gene_type:complete